MSAPVRAGVTVRVVLAAALVLLAALRILDLEPPPVVGADAPPSAFSAERARRHIDALAAEPRPVGSEAHRRARALLVRELEALGLEVERHTTTVVGTWWGAPYDAARVENVVARLRGSSPTGAALLMAHYDSVPHSPGAGDDASGVAVLLETARALRQADPPRNDVIFLFTDAEEAGALGAQGFRRDHPWSRDVRVALNFDSRGASGPAALFDTSAGNGRLVEALAEAAPRAVASSLFNEVARRMGHATDLRTFKDAGVPSMNFGFTDGAVHYHTPRDTPEALDLRSVQQLGDYALPLARRLASADLGLLARESGEAGQDRIYFDVGRGRLVHYPASAALPIAALILLAWAALAYRARSEGSASIRGIALGALGVLGMVAAAAAGAWALVAGLRRAFPALGAMPGDPHGVAPYRLGLSLLALAAAAAIYPLLRRRLEPYELALGALVPWCGLLVAASLLAPGASHFFAWPLAGALVGAAMARWASGGDRPAAEAAALLAGALPAIALAVTGPYLLFVALQLPRGALAAGLVALVAGLFLPHLEFLGGARSRWPSALLGLAGIAALGVGLVRAEPSAARPRANSLAYALDRASGRAAWVTADRHLPAAHAPYFNAPAAPVQALDPSIAGRITRHGEAPALDIPPPSAALLADERRGGARRLRLRVRSARAAPEIFVLAESGVILGATVEGQPVAEPAPFRASAAEPWGIRWLGAGAEGFEVEIEVEGDAPVALRLLDRTYELPPSLLRTPSPPELMPVPFWLAGSTFVADAVRF